MLFSKSAKLAGQTGFFFDTDKNAPDDAVSVKDADASVALNLGAGKDYTFDKKGALVVSDVALKPPSPEELSARAESLRQTAYQKEADPLFFKWQRGEATEADWLTKIEEIKTRFPKGN